MQDSVRWLGTLTRLDLRTNGLTGLPEGLERLPVVFDQLRERGCLVYL
ncbi:hypothetical protein [Deinococcus sp. AJ005]|nr:hypothetical protein [Deinococcus sp. AJ005]